LNYGKNSVLFSRVKMYTTKNKWMEVENIIVSEVNQDQKVKGHMVFSHM
jgi:hypothetical protein